MFNNELLTVNKFKQLSMRALLISLLFSFAAFGNAEDQTWQVNLKDADIRAFVTQVADITGYSFVIDPRVKGKVTVVSNAPMDKNAVYEMFLSVLGVHGFAAIPGTGVIKIVQQNDAKQEADNPNLLKRVPKRPVLEDLPHQLLEHFPKI